MTAPLRSDPTIVEVKLGARSYDIVIGRGVIASLGARIAALRPGAKTFIVTDENVARHVLPAAEAALAQAGVKSDRIVVPPGEGSKSFAVFEQVCEAIIASRIERGDLVVALGGGVIGDLAGFAAAVVRRGLDYVQVPTTLLAQVDSSVGGKTAINSSHGKNLVGAFHQPILVVADIGAARHAAAARIPRRLCRGRQIRPAWRCRLLRLARSQLARDLRRRQSPEALRASTPSRVSCRAKAAIVARDERETGDRALLNLGHTFGHALEAACGFSDRLLHGEAIAIGMALAFGFSAPRQGLMPRPKPSAPFVIWPRSACRPGCKDIPGPLLALDQLMDADRAGQESEARNAYIHSGARHRRSLHRDRRRSSARCARFSVEKLAER